MTQRWRKVDSNLRAPDYGEPSGAREVAHAARRRGDQGRAVGDESASRNRKFESTPLQRRVHEPSVPAGLYSARLARLDGIGIEAEAAVSDAARRFDRRLLDDHKPRAR